MNYYLVMNFITSRKKSYTITLQYVKETVSAADCNKLMDTIIDLQIFYPDKGLLCAKRNCYLEKSEKVFLEIQ